MPRSYTRKYPKYRKRTYRKRCPPGTACKALRIAKYARKIAKPELKYKDNVSAGPTALAQNPANATFWDINCPTLGAETYKRIGNQVTNLSLHGQFDLNHNSAGSTVQRVKVMVVQMPQSRNEAVDFTQLFTSTNVFDPLKHIEYAKSYKILYERQFILDKDLRRMIHVSFSRKLGFKSRYSAADGDYGDVSQNLIQMFMWTDVATNFPTWSALSTRWKFSDA